MRRLLLPLFAVAFIAAPQLAGAQAAKPALYTADQASAGAAVYSQSCAACHGSQLEGVAAPGTICLSEDAYRQVKARLDISVSDLGITQLKNITEPIRVYSLQVGATAQATAVSTAEVRAAPALAAPPPKLSIAVLPFVNMSGDAEQEYFADGIVEDLTTALSRFGTFSVVSRTLKIKSLM